MLRIAAIDPGQRDCDRPAERDRARGADPHLTACRGLQFDEPGLPAAAGITPREGLRMTEPDAKALADADDATILEAMAINPILIQRPLVETDKGVVLARPTDKVREIL
jgi:hypothetical protein